MKKAEFLVSLRQKLISLPEDEAGKSAAFYSEMIDDRIEEGMTEEEVSKALEPFYTKSINGTGLGLSIVSRLVESNGGTMEIVSKPGVGTDVVLKFPGKMV